jgi:hypothetical protein
MSNRVVIQDGYSLPFDGYKRKRRASGGLKRMQSKMRTCASKWRSSGKKGSYRAHMTRCLKSGR